MVAPPGQADRLLVCAVRCPEQRVDALAGVIESVRGGASRRAPLRMLILIKDDDHIDVMDRVLVCPSRERSGRNDFLHIVLGAEGALEEIAASACFADVCDVGIHDVLKGLEGVSHTHNRSPDWSVCSITVVTATDIAARGRAGSLPTSSCLACRCSRWSWSSGDASPWTASRTAR